eukprot:g1317.t1
MFQDNFPEILLRAVVVRAPWLFYGVWRIVQTFITKSMADKIRIHSAANIAADIGAVVPLERVPEFLGGSMAWGESADPECSESCRLEMPAELLSCHGCEGCNSSAEVDVQTAVSELCAGLNSQLQLTGDIKATQLQKLLEHAGVSKDEETVKTIMACFGQGPEGRISIEDLAGMKHRKNNAEFGARTLAEGG